MLQLLHLLKLLHLLHVLHSGRIVGEVHVWHPSSRALHCSHLCSVVLGHLAVHLTGLLRPQSVQHLLLLIHWLTVDSHILGSSCLLTHSLLEQGLLLLLLLLLKLLLLGRIEIYRLAIRANDRLHVRNLSHHPWDRASLTHPWRLAHLPTEWSGLNIRRSIRHTRCASMTLLAPLGGHIVRCRPSHLGVINVNGRSRPWRTSTHARRRMLHWDIAHIVDSG